MKLSDEDHSKANILITDSRRACLADFGLATAKDSKSFAITTAVSIRTTGTLRWQAPELLDPESDDALCVNSMASDVYAYACVCYEVLYMTFHNIRTLSHFTTDLFWPNTISRDRA